MHVSVSARPRDLPQRPRLHDPPSRLHADRHVAVVDVAGRGCSVTAARASVILRQRHLRASVSPDRSISRGPGEPARYRWEQTTGGDSFDVSPVSLW